MAKNYPKDTESNEDERFQGYIGRVSVDSSYLRCSMTEGSDVDRYVLEIHGILFRAQKKHEV